MQLSRSKWSKPPSTVASLHHGENLTQHPYLLKSGTINWDMINYDYTDMEYTVTQCVNPCEVNPMNCYGLVANRLTGNTLADDLTVTAFLEKQDKQKRGTTADVKLEMEEFSDLSQFLPKCASTPKDSSEEELNTPDFDIEEPFDFAVPVNPIELWETVDSLADIELNKNVNIISTSNGVGTIYENNMPLAMQGDKNIIVDNVTQNKIILYPVKAEGEVCNTSFNNESNGTETPIYVQNTDHDYECTNVDLYQMEQTCSTTNTRSPQIILDPTDSSNSSFSVVESPKEKQNLSLNVDIKFFQDILNTPDVIDTVTSLESEQFNIFSYFEEKASKAVNNASQSALDVPSTSNSVLSQITLLDDTDDSASVISELPKRKSRKRRSYDSDEDYIPPKTTFRSKTKVNYEVDSDDDADDDDDEPCSPPPKKRGRPPGRRNSTVSHASTTSFDSSRGADKYRELRDKNNEASRKSRQKRRVKEQHLEHEADELTQKNIKLKTEVEQLEKLVKSFKDNLFKVILSKK